MQRKDVEMEKIKLIDFQKRKFSNCFVAVYIVTKNNGCFQFTPLLNKDYIVEYDYYINHMKNK